MVFSSMVFLFAFLPAVLLIYYLCPARFRIGRNVVLLLFSLFFYFFGEPRLILVMLLSIGVNYIFGLLIQRQRNAGRTGRPCLIASVLFNLSLLGYYKYFNFFLENINTLAGARFAAWDIVMPIGISFYTFQAMSYVFDVYMGRAQAQKNPINMALYISMFPQLIAGPIVRYTTINEELANRNESVENFTCGITRFICGLAKKVILANTMGLIADEIFALQMEDLAFNLAWLGAVAYSLQIFYDFSGYSDMAIGLGRMFGFHFLENFNFPYISKSITEFWRRWHISLGTWFRDYVYIPLGGNQVSAARQMGNVLLVWLLTGIWHGAAWNFVAWGLYFAVLLLVEKFLLAKYIKKCPALLRHICTLVLVAISWVIFRSENLPAAMNYIAAMFRVTGTVSPYTSFYLIQYRYEWAASVLFATPVMGLLRSLWGAQGKHAAKEHVAAVTLKTLVQQTASLGVFLLTLLYLVNSTFNPFIYFRF